MFCRKCGTKIPDDSQFCVKCGVGVIPPNAISSSFTGTAVAVAPVLEPARTSNDSIAVPFGRSGEGTSTDTAVDKQKVEQFAAHYRRLTTADLSSMNSNKDDLLPQARIALEAELRARPEPLPSTVYENLGGSSNERATKKVKVVGRIGRLEYATWLLPVIFGEGLCWGFIDQPNAAGNETVFALLVIAFWGLMVFSWFLIAGRCHDLDMTGWSVLILAIPFVNLAFGIYLFGKPGTTGENRFGSEPPAYWPSLGRLRTMFK